MNIDEDARVAAVDALMARGFAWTHSTDLVQWVLNAYLTALPSAEPGRDRIAVVTTSGNLAAAQVLYRGSEVSEHTWQCLEAEVGGNWGLARAIVRCNLPRPAEPVEVEGSVEVVGP